MKQIRRNIFETNSSSTHSIVLCGEDYKIPDEQVRILRYYDVDTCTLIGEKFCSNALKDYDTVVESNLTDDKLTYIVNGGYFDWSLFSCIGFNQKISWWCSLPEGMWEKDTVDDIIREAYPNVLEIIYNVDSNNHYVDHGYRQRCLDDIYTIGLKEFLTNDKYVILGGNDNECVIGIR